MKLVGWFLATMSLASLLDPRVARANGRFPTAQHVLVGPGTASSTIALRTTFGFVVSDDGGASFHWLCETALGYPSMAPYDPPFAMDALGRLHVGLNDPGSQTRVERDRCTFATDAALDGRYIQDLDNTPDGQTLVSITSLGNPDATNRVYRSDDQGTTWRALGDGHPILYETVEVAPSDTQRVYATATLGSDDPATSHAVFYRSDDGGATLREQYTLPMGMATTAYVAGVDPSDADTVYVRAPLTATFADDAGLGAMATVLLRSRDGGGSWAEVARSHGAMAGFAISDDGRTVWWGGSDAADGLQRSDDGGGTFQRVGDAHVLCLRQHAGVLYVCTDYVLQPDHFALYRSHDRGATLEPLLSLGDIRGAFTCGADSPEYACAAAWPTQQGSLPPATTARDAGTTMDATGATEMASPPSNCGCTTAGAPGRGSLAGAALASLAFVRRRRAR